MDRVIIFALLALTVVAVSRRTMFDVRSHGFYRMVSWLCIAWLLAANCRVWFDYPFSVRQLFSWAFLIISVYLVVAGVIMLKKTGKPQNTRDEKSLYNFERTTELIDRGIFRYIRHPLYSSLIFLTWGICFKNPAPELLLISLLSTISLYLTAKFDEKECIAYFGNKYVEYVKKSKRFIPFVF